MRKGGLGQYGRDQVAAAGNDMPRYLRTAEERRVARLAAVQQPLREQTAKAAARES